MAISEINVKVDQQTPVKRLSRIHQIFIGLINNVQVVLLFHVQCNIMWIATHFQSIFSMIAAIYLYIIDIMIMIGIRFRRIPQFFFQISLKGQSRLRVESVTPHWSDTNFSWASRPTMPMGLLFLSEDLITFHKWIIL